MRKHNTTGSNAPDSASASFRITAEIKEGAAIDEIQADLSESAKKVLAALIAGGPASRPTLGAQTALSKQTVSLAMAELEDRQLSEVITSQQGPLGRAAAVYDVAVAAGWLLGIDLGSTHVRVAASTLKGVLILEREHYVEGAPNQANADLGASAGVIIARLIDELSRTHGPLRSACVALSRSVPVLRDWQGVTAEDSDLPRIVRQLSIPAHVPVYAENNVNCAALGESRHGCARDEGNVSYLQIGVGLGAGIISGGSLLRGARGQGGELRRVPVDGIASAGEPGANAEEWLRADALITRYNLARDGEGDGDATASAQVLERAREGLPVARRIVEEEAAGIGHLVALLIAVASPDLVILGGGIGANDELRQLVGDYLDKHGLEVRLTAGDLGTAATVAGAAALAAERYLHGLLAPYSVHALSIYESRWSI